MKINLAACAASAALLAAIALIWLAASDAAGTSLREFARVPAAPHSVLVVRGCKAEDDCRIDYRANGRWIVKRTGDR